jgi:hypothetical protein
MVGRTLKIFVSLGLIQLEHGWIRILDRTELEA